MDCTSQAEAKRVESPLKPKVGGGLLNNQLKPQRTKAKLQNWARVAEMKSSLRIPCDILNIADAGP